MIEACSASGGRLSVQRGTRCATSSSLSSTTIEEVGNDECVLREETQVDVCAPFGGAELDKQRFISTEGKKLRDTHAMRFQRTRKKSEVTTILIKTLQ